MHCLAAAGDGGRLHFLHVPEHPYDAQIQY
jgi:hypothetical protein